MCDRYVLFGAGGVGAAFMCRVATRKNLEILGFYDSNSERSIPGLARICDSDLCTPEDVAIICSVNDTYITQLKDKAKSLGFLDIRHCYDFPEMNIVCYPESIKCEQPSELERFVSNSTKKIASARELFSDQLSLDVFDSFLSIYSKNCLDRHEIPSLPLSDQYMPTDLFPQPPRCVVSVGAYNGDTILDLINSPIFDIKEAICIEANPDNYRIGVERLMEYKDRVKITWINKALGNTLGKLRMSLNGMSSSIADNNSIESCLVDQITLDSLLLPHTVDYITFDIEGAEYSALLGASSLLNRKQKATLAISVYHNVEDLWRIPLLLHGDCGYERFSLRNYSGYVDETILYASR